jgi:26S proteasome regulatory subunit T1
VLLYGPPGTGKTLAARAVANRTDACFIRVIGSELVQKYVGEGARMVRELFQLARSKKACIVFFDEVDAVGGARFDDGAGGDNEVQRTMLEIVNQLDGFDARGNVKVLMATNRPDTLDPALLRPGRLDRKVEFGLPDLEGRAHIFSIHARSMNIDRDIRFELLARLCPNTTGAEIRSVCIEAGMFAIRSRRKVVTEKDMIEAVNKVVKGYSKFSATPKYMIFNVRTRTRPALVVFAGLPACCVLPCRRPPTRLLPNTLRGALTRALPRRGPRSRIVPRSELRAANLGSSCACAAALSTGCCTALGAPSPIAIARRRRRRWRGGRRGIWRCPASMILIRHRRKRCDRANKMQTSRHFAPHTRAVNLIRQNCSLRSHFAAW